MKAYIGAKIILAEEMTSGEFEDKFKKKSGAEQCYIDGYHVEYSNPDGTVYHAWSPENIFERAYRVVSEDEFRLITQG
jgi:hypothetical protein